MVERETRAEALVRADLSAIGNADGSTFILPTGTVTFLLTDVEGSSAAWESEPVAMAKAISRHYEILADAVGRHRGVRPVEQGEGDSIVAAFSRGADAVAAALEAQQRLVAEDWPGGAAPTVRIALHTGDAQLRDAFNYFGPTVIRAARLRALAHGGQVIASRATHDLVADALPPGASWRDLGTHRLRDLGRPEQVFQLCHADVPEVFPPLRGVDVSPNNLPAQLTSFVGRESELHEAGELLDTHRLVTLTGSGGCGKTRLALQLAAERTDLFPDGVWYVELASLDPRGSVAAQVAEALGLADAAEPLEATLDRLAEQTALLVLDNCEHVLGECAALVDALTRRCPALVVLATSRQPLDVPGEVTWRVPSMTLPPGGELPPLDALASLDAVQLFCERAARSRPGFVLDDDNAADTAAICQRLDGIPLALELAAARVRTMGLTDILAGLDDRFRILTGGGRTLVARQQTLLASVDWSYELLEPHEQQVFRRLATFSGAFTLDSALAVGSDDETAAAGADVADCLTGLVDRSLVQLDDGESPTRYRYLETVKAYGRARLHDSGEEEATRDRHLARHLDTAERSRDGLVGTEQAQWLARLDHELDDIRAAMEWASSSLMLDELFRLLSGLSTYWFARGANREGQAWTARALREWPEAPDERRGPVLASAAALAMYASDMTLSFEQALGALEAGKASNDARTTARALDTLATLQQFSDPVGAQPLFDEASALAASVGDRWCQTDAVQKAAYSDFYRDRWENALARAEESAALARELENPFFLSWHETLVGTAAVRTGDHELGRVALRRAIDLAVEVGEPMTIASPASVMVLADLAVGSPEDAEATTDELVALLGERANDGFAALEITYMRSACTLANGDPETAAALLGPVIKELLAENVRYPTALWIMHLGYAELGMGNTTAAARTLTRAREIAQAIGNSALESGADGLEAMMHRVAGRPDRADPLFRRAIGGLREAGIRSDAVDGLELFAGTTAELGNTKTAALLLASVDAARAKHGWTAWVLRPFADMLAQDRARVTDALAGLGGAPPLGLDEALELVLRGRGARGRPATGWGSLTPTEREVVRRVAAGKSNPEIAEALFISRSTVKTHVSHVLAKLGLASRAELAGAAVREGETSPEA